MISLDLYLTAFAAPAGFLAVLRSEQTAEVPTLLTIGGTALLL